MAEYKLTEAAASLNIDVSKLKKIIKELGISVDRRPDTRDSQGHMKIAYISESDYNK